MAAKLETNDQFVDLLVQTYAAAAKTSEQEKLDALRNAVLNAALSGAPDSWKQQLFISLVDSLTVPHLRVLALLDDPPAWCMAAGRIPNDYTVVSELVAWAYPELGPAYVEFLGKDLFYRGLLSVPSLADRSVSVETMQPKVDLSGLPGIRTSGPFVAKGNYVAETGKEFLALIREPRPTKA